MLETYLDSLIIKAAVAPPCGIFAADDRLMAAVAKYRAEHSSAAPPDVSSFVAKALAPYANVPPSQTATQAKTP